jgi:hypothetical protein
MGTDTAPVSYQDVLDHLSEVASKNGDCFRLKVVRRPNATSSVTQHVALFADATWNMISQAESWLGPFAGGGLYVIQVFDGKEGRKQHGVIVPSELPGPPRPPDSRITKSSAWNGPTLVEAAAPMGAGAVALGGTGFDGFSGMVPGPYASTMSPRSTQDAGLGNLFAANEREREELKRERQDIDEKTRKADLEGVKRAADERAQRLEAQITDLKGLIAGIANAKPPPPPPGPDIGAIVSGLIASLSPIALAILQSQAATRQAQLVAEQVRQDRDAKFAETSRARPLIDPQILEMMNSQAKRAEEQVTQFANLMRVQAESAKLNLESQAVAQRSMIQTIADVAQMQLKTGEPEDHGVDWGKVVGGILSGLAMLKQGPGGGVPGGVSGVPGGSGPLAGTNGSIPGASAPIPPAQPLPDIEPAPQLDKIEDRIRAKDPPDQVIEDLKKILGEQEVKNEIAAEGGLPAVFEARLGDFAENALNKTYMDALEKVIVASGIFGAGGAAA